MPLMRTMILKMIFIHIMQVDAQQHLWHKDLYHCNAFMLEHARKHIIGVPTISCKHVVHDNCLIWMASNLKCLPCSKTHSAKPIICFQNIHIGIGFLGQKSKNDRSDFYKDINGETCFLGMWDYFSRYLNWETFVSKSSQVIW